MILNVWRTLVLRLPLIRVNRKLKLLKLLIVKRSLMIRSNLKALILVIRLMKLRLQHTLVSKLTLIILLMKLRMRTILLIHLITLMRFRVMTRRKSLKNREQMTVLKRRRGLRVQNIPLIKEINYPYKLCKSIIPADKPQNTPTPKKHTNHGHYQIT